MRDKIKTTSSPGLTETLITTPCIGEVIISVDSSLNSLGACSESLYSLSENTLTSN